MVRHNWRGVVTVVAVVAVALSGCSHPAGSDGSLTDDWPALAAPKPFVPPSPACYALGDRDPADVTRLPDPVDCAQSHTVETVYAGTFEGEAGKRVTAPPKGGPERRAAYQRCMAEAKTFLGGDWRANDVFLRLAVPLDTQWVGGARWYRCDVYALMINSSYQRAASAQLRGSLKGRLATPEPHCYTAKVSDESFEIQDTVTCTIAHRVELAGIFEAPDTGLPDEKTIDSLGESRCQSVVATYSAVPDNRDTPRRLSWGWDRPVKESWDLGDRGIACYAITPADVDHAIKGAGPTALPVK